MFKGSASKGLRPILILILALAMFMYPQDVLLGASGGIDLWWRYVLPALLPFFILSELLMEAGFVHFLGILLEPLMRPLFHLPGKAAFVVAMGYTSGFPMGAVLAARLRQDGEISRVEGERLLTFTNNPSPGFMFGAVASGLLGQPRLGLLLAGSVYVSNLAVGVLFRFYGSSRQQAKSDASLVRAWQAMLASQAGDSHTFGQILGKAVRQSVTTVMLVGGYIVFFAVVVRILTRWKITTFFALLLHPLLHWSFPFPLIKALLDGLLEMTLGCQGIVNASAPSNIQFAALAFILGWGGLSVFAQVAGFVSATDLRLFPFALARIIHACLAFLLSQIFLHLAHFPASGTFPFQTDTTQIWLNSWRLSSWFFLVLMVSFLTLALVLRGLAPKR